MEFREELAQKAEPAREAAASRLTPEQIEEGQRLARERILAESELAREWERQWLRNTQYSAAPAAEVVFSGAYKHFSRGGELPEPAPVRVEQGANGTLTVSGELRGAQYEAVSRAGLATDVYSIVQPGADGAEGYSMQLEMADGVVHVTRRGVREDLDAKPLTTPAGAVFDPNTRPDPYLVAQIMLRRLDLKTGDERMIEVYDWDNGGEALAAYTIAFRHLGKTSITVPAGTFEANHIILEQKTSADTWFKKRAGHLTEFWTLDNGAIVRILRHREPYDLQLLRMDAPGSDSPPRSAAARIRPD
ncbi:MAG TPA: hypothetical protein ENN80_01060 [Candidatus Hydrogenedentes bacterium]|nr:hypothetical protein [Candidatus Hydrogenedentota bacterium]